MTTHDPFKSAIAIGNVDNTSLAVPSVNQYQSGQQRVLDQVQTIRRTKCKHSTRNGAGTLYVSSPLNDSVFTDSHKCLPVSVNGSANIGNGLSRRQISSEKNVNRQTLRTAKGFSQMTATRSTLPASSTMGRANTSRSEPDLGRRFTRTKQAAPPQSQRLLSNRSSVFLSERSTMGGGQFASNGYLPHPQPQHQPFYQPQPQTILQPPAPPVVQLQHQGMMNGGSKMMKKSNQFLVSTVNMANAQSRQSVVDFGTKTTTKVESGLNGSGVSGDLTMKEAVTYLLSMDQKLQHCGASYIQHSTYMEDKAKQEVCQLNGIQPLVALLQSPNPQICQTASAALRNLSFKNTANKEELHLCGGVEAVVGLLQETDSVETYKQLTGLLWNMSSVESLRPDLVKTAVPALMEKVVVPYTTGPDRTSNGKADPEVFYHATGCMRNFSSGKQSIRQSMRKYRGLVDSLVSYVDSCVEAGTPDDKSLENCVCVLHNLTFQLEAEAPALFQRLSALGQPSRAPQGDIGPIGCFSPQSSKVLEAERSFDFPMVEDPQPTGAGWLIHSKTLQNYLTLLGSSQKNDILEACCGALQNLTAHPGIVSNVISQMVVKKLNGLAIIKPLLRSPKVNLQRNTVALVANLSKNPNLCNPIARKTLPELFTILEAGTEEGTESDDTLSVACQTAHVLTMKEQGMGKPLLNNKLIDSLNNLSKNNYFPKSSKAAALLLYGLWSDKDMQSFLKKKGMSKSSFVNSVTVAANRSVQVVD
ncbi:hypothetical protein NHX12_030702 [Muraenolepis orangiensis]|uniref:Plakophilin 1 n=1 Tax=Muraenolepis orangiensis TaxID=630683 RepID=A0A9Q0ECA6_9TELE|nr:hypothetical protein NHX12_030702 [Muraenolepis orangiensis]